MVEEVRRGLLEFIREELLAEQRLEIGPNTPLLSGGLIDSFRLVQITTFLEERYGVYLPDVDLRIERIDTARQIADLVVEKLEDVS